MAKVPVLTNTLKIFFLLCIGGVCGCSGGVEIVAHRGASYDAPENTLAAFNLAWRKGADAIEGDFFLTKDEQIICIHDSSTKRTAAGIDLDVSQSTTQQLQQLDVGSWKAQQWAGVRIPTLQEILHALPKGKRIFIEPKRGRQMLPHLKDVLAQAPSKTHQAVIISSDKKLIADVKNQIPAVKAYWVCNLKQDRRRKKWNPTLSRILQTLKECKADGIIYGLSRRLHKIMDKRFVEALHKPDASFHVSIAVVDDPEDARRFCRFGVDSIITNRPGFLRDKLLKSKKPHNRKD